MKNSDIQKISLEDKVPNIVIKTKDGFTLKMIFSGNEEEHKQALEAIEDFFIREIF